MTLCIASLAADGKAIVCVSDKGVAYGTDIQWDTDVTKIVPVGSTGVYALLSGGQIMVSRVLRGLCSVDDFGDNVAQTILDAESVYRAAESDILEAAFMHPYLTVKEYKDALSQTKVNAVIKRMSQLVEQERANTESQLLQCWMILCGFDADYKPFILYLQPPGVVSDHTDVGNAATGSGSDRAMARFLWNGWERKYSIARVLFDTLDAKFDAEMNPSVGADFDALIITSKTATTVPENIKTLVERAWKKTVRSPWDTYDPDTDIPEPTDTWKDELETYCDGLLPTENVPS